MGRCTSVAPATSNDHVADCVNAYLDRFVGVASVNLEKPYEAVRSWTVRCHAYRLQGAAIWLLVAKMPT